MPKITYEKPKKNSRTKPGTPPSESRKPRKPSTRNKPAKGYDPVTKTWAKNA